MGVFDPIYRPHQGAGDGPGRSFVPEAHQDYRNQLEAALDLNDNAKLLVAGQPGCGKTTLLLGIAQKLRGEGRVVAVVDLEAQTAVQDLGTVEMYLAATAELLFAAGGAGAPLSTPTLESCRGWLARVRDGDEVAQSPHEIATALRQHLSAVRESRALRDELRDLLRQGGDEPLQLLSRVLEDLAPRRPVVILDGLDKLPPAQALEVFLNEKRKPMAEAPGAAVLTIPLSVVYEPTFNVLSERYNNAAELTRGTPAEAFVLSASPKGPLSLSASTRLLNAERQLLQGLAGPTILAVSAQTEKALRQGAPDFFTWAAHSYVLPEPAALAAIAQKLGAAPSAAAAKAPAEEPVRFLHLSDVHLRPDRVKRYDQDRVLRGLVEFLERDRDSFPLDLVFVTGDLAQSGRADEYALVADLLRALLRATNVPPERTFVVPGNHDVDRRVGRWLLRTLSRDEESTAFFEDETSRAFHAKKFAAYRDTLGGLLGPARPLGLAVGAGAVETVEVRGAKVAVASFNSAWFCQGDDDQGKLWLGEANVDRAAQKAQDEGAAFAVALMHHPFDYLHEDERENVERYLERAFDLVLRGHLHKDKARAILSARGGFVEVAAPAAYQGSQWPNGCFLGEIRPRQRTVRLRPYTYASGADPWVLDAKVFPDDAHDGHCHTYPVAEKRRKAGAFAQHLERTAEEALRSAGPEVQREIAARAGLSPSGEESLSGRQRPLARHASSLAADPALLPAMAKKSLSAALLKATRQWAKQSLSEAPIFTDEPRFLEQALTRARRGVIEIQKEVPFRWMSEKDFVSMLHALLSRIVVSSVAQEANVLSGGLYNDILIGANGETAARRAVIEVKKRSRFQDVRWLPFESVDALDDYLNAADAAHGALITFGDLPFHGDAPEPEHIKTPAGRDVLLFHL